MRNGGERRLSFAEAVRATEDVKDGYQRGLGALPGKYRSYIELGNGSHCDGSLNIDDVTSAKYPQDPRWDYAFDCNSETFFVEVHPASTSDVAGMIRKLAWLKSWLVDRAPELNKLKAVSTATPYYWIASGKVAIPKTSPQYRSAVKHGISPIRRWIYDRLPKRDR